MARLEEAARARVSYNCKLGLPVVVIGIATADYLLRVGVYA
jgi:hypothetical protein